MEGSGVPVWFESTSTISPRMGLSMFRIVLLGFSDLEVVQNRDEVFHEGVELAVRHPHVGM